MGRDERNTRALMGPRKSWETQAEQATPSSSQEAFTGW